MKIDKRYAVNLLNMHTANDWRTSLQKHCHLMSFFSSSGTGRFHVCALDNYPFANYRGLGVRGGVAMDALMHSTSHTLSPLT